ncbi:MAG: hypothetical protein FJ206_02790 [Gemmatimonadetes bacterium]|nr:hypothetical protein [Gemmatimonadota bacterium]
MNGKALTVLALVAGAACSYGTSGPEGTGQVVVQLANRAPGGAGAAGSAVDILAITKVQLVARKVRLARASGSCPSNEAAGEGSEAAGEVGCPVVKAGPLLLEPPITDGAIAAFTADLPAGSYSRLRLQVHKPTGGNDQAFLQANPTFDGVSIRVEGSYNAAPFTFVTGLTTVQEIPLDSPIEVVEGTPVEVTLLLDVKAWFAAPGGTGWVDPTGLTQQQRARVEQNIRTAFRAFRDKNRDATAD